MPAPRSSAPPSIRELAAKLGVSRTTVSLALRNDPCVAPDTRRRILDVAHRAGYRSNALVNALMAQVRQGQRLKPTGEVVTYLTAYERENDWKAIPSVVAQYEGARERAAELGFKVEIMWMGTRGVQSAHIARVLAARGIRGSILAPLAIDHHTLELAWNDHTTVAIGYSFRQVALHRAVHHNMNAAFACYGSLRRLGYERIGLAMHEADDARVHNFWISGYLGSQRVHGGERLAPCLFSDFSNPKPFLAWYRRARPDAIIGIWPHLPLAWLREAGVGVPGEVAFASLDIGDARAGEIAGIRQDNRNVGMAAMDVLAGQLFRNEIGVPAVPKVTMIEGVWMDGATAPRRAEVARGDGQT